MTDPVESQPQSHNEAEGTSKPASDEDPLLRQSQQIDQFLYSLRSMAHKKLMQPAIADTRSTLDSHTAAETILLMQADETALKKGTNEMIDNVFRHEINYLVMMMLHGVFLSNKPPIPEHLWGEDETQEREKFTRELSESWDESNTRMRQLKDILEFVRREDAPDIDVETILDESIQSVYIGTYLQKDMLYPHHLVDVTAFRTIVKGLQNVKTIFTTIPGDRRALLEEMNTSTVTVADFINIFPDRHMYLLHGNIHRKLNQFQVNLFFEMLQSAKKYRVSASDPIEIFIDETGRIDVKNRSNNKFHNDLTEFGTRGGTTSEQNGNGFGIFKMQAIANLTGEVIEFSNELLGDTDSPPYGVTCSLKKAA